MDLYKNTNLIEWKEGRILGFSGKELIDLKNGSFKLVKVAPFAKYPVHLHPHKTEVLLILEGSLTISIEKTRYNGKPSDFYVFPYNTEHSIVNESDMECIVFIGSINN